MMNEKRYYDRWAGLVGFIAFYLSAKRGYKVSIYERRPDMRKEKVTAGRSINLALSDRGIMALEEVGIMEEISEIAIPMHGRYIHNVDGNHFSALWKDRDNLSIRFKR